MVRDDQLRPAFHGLVDDRRRDVQRHQDTGDLLRGIPDEEAGIVILLLGVKRGDAVDHPVQVGYGHGNPSFSFSICSS